MKATITPMLMSWLSTWVEPKYRTIAVPMPESSSTPGK